VITEVTTTSSHGTLGSLDRSEPVPACCSVFQRWVGSGRHENTINFKIGFLLQPRADWTQDAVTGGYQQNVCIRWVQLTRR
jgi:hypothetical protein